VSPSTAKLSVASSALAGCGCEAIAQVKAMPSQVFFVDAVAPTGVDMPCKGLHGINARARPAISPG
jgi:hypothetical protein